MLDFKRLQYLEAVHRCHSFTRASEELFVSQSAVSIAVKTLEQELGVKLIVRTPQDVSFTPEGEQFLLCARRILRECENAEREMADLSEEKSRVLHFGVSPTLGLNFQQFLHSPEFSQKYPKAMIYLEEGSMNNHIEKIRQELLDLSFNGLPDPADAAGLELIPISTARVYAVMAPEHPMADASSIPIASLDHADIVLLDEKARIRSLMMAEFERAGVAPRIRSSHEQIFCMLNTIKFGNFLGFINASDPGMVRYLHSNGLIIRDLSPSVSFQTGFLMKSGKHLPQFAYELIDTARKIEGTAAAAGPASL